MKYLPFVVRHIRRDWIRSTSTVLAIALCIFLFCTLQTVIQAVNWGLRSANAARLVTHHAVSMIFNLPLAHEQKIAALPGVRAVAIRTLFGGFYQDPKNFFTNLAVEPEPYLELYPEYILAPDQKRAFLADMRGCVIGPGLARRFGWKLGDAFQMRSIFPQYRVAGPFEFVVRGIYQTDEARYPATNDSLMLFRYDYLYEKTKPYTEAGGQLGAGMFVVGIDDPKRAGVISRQIDDLFENSRAQTKTQTEAAFRASIVSLAGNLALLLNGIGLAVAFTILLVTANTMSMAVRERRTEIAVLKTLGFTSRLVMGLVLTEAGLLGAVGGGLGILLGRGMIRTLPRVPFIGDAIRSLPSIGLSPALGASGLGLALLLAMAAGFVPSLFAYRARITEMLRQV